jgi:glycosyltransferase involved in cell wall biosynthesis
MKPLASIVITTYNSAGFIGPTIESALHQDFGSERYEVVVVDDGSQDRTLSILKGYEKSYRNLHIIAQENEGPAVARTKVINKAEGHYIFMMSHDCIAERFWISDVVKIFEKNPKVGLIQGKLLPTESINLPIYHCNNFTSFRVTFDTAEIAYRAEALDKAGRYFDEKFSANGDDADLAWRIIESGYGYRWVDKVLMRHIILPRRFVDDLRSLPNMMLFPYLIKIHPGIRAFLPYRVVWGSKFKYLLLILLILAMFLALSGYSILGAVFILLALLFNLYRTLRSTSSYRISLWQKLFIVFPFHLLFDNLLGLYLVAGSIRHRSLIL